MLFKTNRLIWKIKFIFIQYYFKVKFVSIYTENSKLFFHNGIEWARSINSQFSVNLDDITNSSIDIQLIANSRVIVKFSEDFNNFAIQYDFPERDFCLFKSFPHAQLVYPMISLGTKVTCTCTLIWLIRYSRYYMNEDYTHYDRGLYYEYEKDFNNFSIRTCLHQNFKQKLNECNIEERLKNCHYKQVDRMVFSFSTNADYVYFFKLLQYIIGVYLRPFFCILGVVTNVIIFKVVTNKAKKKHLKNSMYKHILANSLFNASFCLIHIFSLVNLCVLPRGSFCSSVYKSKTSQNFKIYLVLLFGNSLKLSSNFSYICFSVSRFYLSTSNPSSYFKKFQEWNLRRFYSIAFLTGLTISIFKVFQFRVNEYYSDFDQSFPFDAFGINYCEKEDNIFLQCKLFSLFNLVNNLLNNVIFLVFSILIDASLIKFSNENLKRKLEMSLDEAHVLEAIKLKKKINKMIVTNGTLYFFSHIPEFLTTIFLIIFSKRLAHFCYVYISCLELSELAESFNFLSIASQIFVFLKFDKNFKESFDNLISKLRVRFTTVQISSGPQTPYS